MKPSISSDHTPSARPVGRVFFPLDEDLALLPGSFSPFLHQCIVRLGTLIPFDQVPEQLAALLGVTVSHATWAAPACSVNRGAALRAPDRQPGPGGGGGAAAECRWGHGAPAEWHLGGGADARRRDRAPADGDRWAGGPCPRRLVLLPAVLSRRLHRLGRASAPSARRSEEH